MGPRGVGALRGERRRRRRVGRGEAQRGDRGGLLAGEELDRRPAFLVQSALGEQRLPVGHLAVHLRRADGAAAGALARLRRVAVRVHEDDVRRAAAQPCQREDRPAGDRLRTAGMDHRGLGAGDGGRDPGVVAEVEQWAAPHAVIGVHDGRVVTVHRAAQQRRLPRPRNAGHDDHRV